MYSIKIYMNGTEKQVLPLSAKDEIEALQVFENRTKEATVIGKNLTVLLMNNDKEIARKEY